MGREDEIKLIAYRMWEEEGCPNGQDCEHWFRAEVIWNQKQDGGVEKEEKKGASKPSAKKIGAGKESPPEKKATKKK